MIIGKEDYDDTVHKKMDNEVNDNDYKTSSNMNS